MITVKEKIFRRIVPAGHRFKSNQVQKVKRYTIYLFGFMPVYRRYTILATNL